MERGNINPARRHQFKNLLITLISLVIADGIISQFLVRLGLGYEGNPFLQALVSETNFLLIKIAGALLCAFILWEVFKTRPQAAFTVTIISTVLYTGILYWNIGLYILY